LEESVAISDKKIFRHRSLGRLFATTTSHLTNIGSRQRAVYKRRAVGQTKLNGLLDQRARLGRRARLVGTRALPSAHFDRNLLGRSALQLRRSGERGRPAVAEHREHTVRRCAPELAEIMHHVHLVVIAQRMGDAEPGPARKADLCV
jgi:hypothetical protein